MYNRYYNMYKVLIEEQIRQKQINQMSQFERQLKYNTDMINKLYKTLSKIKYTKYNKN